MLRGSPDRRPPPANSSSSRTYPRTFPMRGSFASAITTTRLPEVSWVYAPLEFDEHPPYSNPQGVRMGNVTEGMQWSVDQINAIVRGGLWPDVAVFLTWDDWGGWYDHVEPPTVEVWHGNGAHPGYVGSQFRYGPRG